MKISDIPDNAGFPAVRPQQLGCICSAFFSTYSYGKTWLPIFTEPYLFRNQFSCIYAVLSELVSFLEVEIEYGNALVTEVKQLDFKSNIESQPN